MSFDIPTSLATRSVSCRHMTPEEIQRIYDTLPGHSYINSDDDVSPSPSVFRTDSTSQADYEEEDVIFAHASDALSRLQLPECDFLCYKPSHMPSVDYHDEDQSLSRSPPKRETIEDYCFGMDFTESFVPAASSVLKRPLPVPGTPKYENYRYDLPLRRLEPTPGTVEHKEYMYDAISALLEKTRSLNHRAGEEEDAETNTLCQNVEKILENWSGFDVVPHDFDEVNPDCWWKQEYEAALEGDHGPLCIEELREYEFDEEDREDEEEEEDDGFQEPTEYEKENENELYMWGGLK